MVELDHSSGQRWLAAVATMAMVGCGYGWLLWRLWLWSAASCCADYGYGRLWLWLAAVATMAMVGCYGYVRLLWLWSAAVAIRLRSAAVATMAMVVCCGYSAAVGCCGGYGYGRLLWLFGCGRLLW
jgi:hypothetical protein